MRVANDIDEDLADMISAATLGISSDGYFEFETPEGDRYVRILTVPISKEEFEEAQQRGKNEQ
jgi:hypothetical protein